VNISTEIKVIKENDSKLKQFQLILFRNHLVETSASLDATAARKC